ncbi:MAG: hypothetical protein DYG89_34485 [Caldilinea sp. CFX5]|nr:hypothetical protein [Caldilinea sp. CFX5]
MSLYKPWRLMHLSGGRYSPISVCILFITLPLLLWITQSLHLSAPAAAAASPEACIALGFGQSSSETIAIPGELDCVTFVGAAGDQILARVIKTTGALGPVIEIFAPSGTKVCGTIHSDLTCALNTDGLHRISIKDFGGPNTGDYRIYLQRLNAPLGCIPVSFGASPAAGLIELAADVGCFTFDGATADQVRVRVVKTTGTLGAVIENYRPDGTKLCGTIHQELTCQLDATGRHTILVKDFGGPNTGSYQLHIQRLNGAVACVPLSFDAAPLAAVIDAPAEMDCFPFQGANGVNVRVRVVKTAGNLGAVLEIARPNGTLLCGTIHAELTCQLDADGLHTVLVKDFGGSNTGTYQISLQCLSATCTPPPGCTQPGIEFTFVPPYNSRELLQGRVTCAQSADHAVAVYIYQEGWWTKPRFGEGLTPIRADGTWTTEIVTGGHDECATAIAAFLLRKGDPAEELHGASKLPPALQQRALAQVITHRRYPRTLSFAGRTWYVKSCAGPLGPDQNLFSDRPEDVYVDTSGQLHLRIVPRDGKWYATEVVASESLGYGTYRFTLNSRVDQLDKNVVLGLFTWDDHAPQFSYRELDIEFSRWGEDSAPNAQFVVQPFHLPDHRHRFNLALTGNQATHRFTWQPGRADFASFQGASPDPSNLIEAWTHAHNDIPPAGGETPRINLWLFGHQPPSNGQAVEVIVESFTFEPLRPITITAIRPNQGRNDITNLIDIAGAGFAQGVVVSLGSAALTTTFVSTAHLQAVVPAGVAAGAYDVTVANPAGERATQARGYTAFDPINNDDLFALEYEFYLDPVTPRANAPTDLILKVHRQGGKDPLFDVKVRFYQGDPKVNGLRIGESTLPSLTPRGEEQSIPLPWTPITAGNYTLYAVIDPDNLIAESYEENNTVSRAVIVLPPAPDQKAPHVDSFVINGGAAATSERVVRLDTQASDEPPSGTVAKLRFVEYAYREAAGIWVPVQQSDWLDYATARANFAWQLLPPAGVKALHVWAVDAAGNISRFPFRRQINYTPPSEHVQFNQRQLYRYTLNAGQTLVAQLTALTGDPDLYLWPPDYTTRPPWVSNLRTAVDDLSITAPVAGLYQVEVYGFSAANYQLAVTLGNVVAAQSQGGRDPSKDPILSDPLLAPTAQPDDRFAILPPESSRMQVFLPIAFRAPVLSACPGICVGPVENQ